MANGNDGGTGLKERPAANTTHKPGAVAATGEGRRRKRGLLPWILGLLALLLIGGILAAVLGGGDDDAATTQESGQQSGQATGGSETGGAAAGTTGGATDGGTLTARGDAILPAPSGGLGDYVGETATGERVVVQSVVQSAADPNRLEGFFVGTSEQDRVYVEWGGDVGADEADFQPEVGQAVNLEGPVRPAPEDPAQTLKLDQGDAQVVTSQGGYVNADQVSAAE